MVLSVYIHEHGISTPMAPTADEQADSVVRKVIMHFGPRNLMRVQIGYRNLVEVDEGGLVRIVEDLDDYENLSELLLGVLVSSMPRRLRRWALKLRSSAVLLKEVELRLCVML